MPDQLSTRCAALSTELDDNTLEKDSDAIPHSPEHTTAFSEAVGGDKKWLWEGYGIIADILVHQTLFLKSIYV